MQTLTAIPQPAATAARSLRASVIPCSARSLRAAVLRGLGLRPLRFLGRPGRWKTWMRLPGRKGTLRPNELPSSLWRGVQSHPRAIDAPASPKHSFDIKNTAVP